MELSLFAAVLLGIVLVLIRYSLWRKKYCHSLPGIEPGLFNIPGDLTKIFMRAASNVGLPILHHLGQILKERNELFQQQQLFYFWGFYKPHVFFVKAEAVKVIQEKKKQYLRGNKENATEKRKAFMHLLLERHFETQEFSEEDICEEVNTFVAAGHDTVAITIAWALYLIGLYPDVQTKIHEELDRIFGTDEKRDVTERDLNDLEYLDCVLKETNRIYTAVPIISRYLQKDTKICGYTIPKGSICAVLIYFLHRDKDVFPEPEKFDPDRFLPENSAKIPEYGYIPFSAGPRNYIGQKFAVM
ncbi:cytochrome P450 4V2 [Nephila pilipes]|uniref:Cytochrome P450 4V2 n=1 Tax=Nephila pilipes TaxID=299642 RepID=A0A8X6N4I1_NEPPI|nr:cytochrome P450 4V2 [Nephila pilipes]